MFFLSAVLVSKIMISRTYKKPPYSMKKYGGLRFAWFDWHPCFQIESFLFRLEVENLCVQTVDTGLYHVRYFGCNLVE